MSIVKGARNLDNAKKFYDWALTPKAQALAAQAKQFQIPSNVAAPVSPLSPKTADIKLINYDFAKYGTSAERKRLLERWDREVGSIAEVTACSNGSPDDRRTIPVLDRMRSPSLSPLPAHAQGQLNLYCSSPNTAWCQGMAVGFEKATGTKVAVIQKATGEMLAQIKAERANPKGDIWWAGAGRQLPAGRRGRPARDVPLAQRRAALRLGAAHHRPLEEPRRRRLRRHPRARLQHRDRATKKKLPVPKCWKDLANPAYKGEVMLGNPNSSGTAYLMLASLVQVIGEDEAFRLHGDAQPERQPATRARASAR